MHGNRGETMRYSLLIGLAGGCNAVWVCSTEELGRGIDCCTTDARCRSDYGDERPYCIEPGRHTGVCSECRADYDCGPVDGFQRVCDFGSPFERPEVGLCLFEGDGS
jgi:hypothetical protein